MSNLDFSWVKIQLEIVGIEFETIKPEQKQLFAVEETIRQENNQAGDGTEELEPVL